MSLTELIAGVETHEKTLTVYNADGDTVEAVREHFADRNVAVESGGSETGPERFLVLGWREEFITAAGIDDLLAEPEPERPSFGSRPYEPILDRLDETMFTSYSRGKMLSASREIEDRAWRVGNGELHAGFQRVSTLVSQLDVYSALGERDGLTVHAYVTPDAALPERTEFSIHPERSDEIARVWFVAFDGAGLDSNKCALLAEERTPGEFYGFWTYDPDTVDYVINHLTATYVAVDGGRSAPR